MIILAHMPRSLIRQVRFRRLQPSPVFDIRFFNNGETGAHGWLDRIILQGRRLNSFSGTTMQYSDSKSVAPGRITGFRDKKYQQ